MQQQTKNHKKPKKLKNQRTKTKPKNYDVEISGIFTVYMRIQYQVIVYYLVKNMGPVGRQGVPSS